MQVLSDVGHGLSLVTFLVVSVMPTHGIPDSAIPLLRVLEGGNNCWIAFRAHTWLELSLHLAIEPHAQPSQSFPVVYGELAIWEFDAELVVPLVVPRFIGTETSDELKGVLWGERSHNIVLKIKEGTCIRLHCFSCRAIIDGCFQHCLPVSELLQ